MTGINTSLGINSVASHIAGLEASGTQVVTTNTGAQVTGLEAAAYEFGAILSSYPADAPPLTRNAAVFQVTDADGNTSMMSLNDLATKIQQQTGYDPLVEFSAGIGMTSAGYNLADINQVLSSIERQYTTMSFTQLTQVQGIENLNTVSGIDEQPQSALDGLAQALGELQPEIFIASPLGISLNQPIIGSSLADYEVLNELNALLLDNYTQYGIAEAQHQFINNNPAPMTPVESLTLLNAQSAATTPHWPSEISEAAQIVTAQDTLTQANNALTQLTATSFSAPLSVALVQGLNGGLQGLLSSISVPANESQWTTLEAMTSGTNPAVGHFFMTSANLFAGASPGHSYNSGSDPLEILIYNDGAYNSGTLSWEAAQATYPGITLAQWLNGCAGAPGYDWRYGASSNPTRSVEIEQGECPPFNGFISACGLDPNNPADVMQFNAVMEELVPGITAEPIVTAQQLLELRNALNGLLQPLTNAQQNVTNAQQALTTAQNTYDSSRANALASAEAALQELMASVPGYREPYTAYTVSSAAWNSAEAQSIRQPYLVSLGEAFDDLQVNQTRLNSLIAGALASPDSNISALGAQIQTLREQINSMVNQLSIDQYAMIVPQQGVERTTELLNSLRAAQTALDASPTSPTALFNANRAIAVANYRIGNGADFASLNEAIVGIEQLLQTQNTALTSVSQTYELHLSQLQANHLQMMGLTEQLMSVPVRSLSDALRDIEISTGVDLNAAFESIIGDGPLTISSVSALYDYVNENLPIGQSPLVNPFTSSNITQSAIGLLQSAFSQTTFTSALAASPAGISVDAAVFTIPGTSGQVSLNQLLATIQQTTGADLATPINEILDGGLITSDAVFEINNAIILPSSVASQSALAQLRTALSGSISSDVISGNAGGVGLSIPALISPANQAIIVQNQTQITQLTDAILADELALQNAINAFASAQQGWPTPHHAGLIAQAQQALDAALKDQIPDEIAAATRQLYERQFLAYGPYIQNVNTARAAVTSARNQLEAHRNQLNSLISAGMASQAPGAIATQQSITQIQNSINNINSSITALQNQIDDLTAYIGNVADRSARLPVLQSLVALGAAEDYQIQELEFLTPEIPNPYGDNPTALLTSLQEQLAQQFTALGKHQNELLPLQSQLLVSAAPLQSLSQVIGGITQTTGIDLTAMVNAVTDGSISLSSLGLLNAYLSSPAAVGQTPSPAIINIVAAEQDFSAVDDELNNFTVDPRVRDALTLIGNALSQLEVSDLTDAEGLSINAAIFDNLPEVAVQNGLEESASVSLLQVLNFIQQGLGVNLSEQFNGLIDQSGNISIANLNGLTLVLNQSIPELNLQILTPMTRLLSGLESILNGTNSSALNLLGNAVTARNNVAQQNYSNSSQNSLITAQIQQEVDARASINGVILGLVAGLDYQTTTVTYVYPYQHTVTSTQAFVGRSGETTVNRVEGYLGEQGESFNDYELSISYEDSLAGMLGIPAITDWSSVEDLANLLNSQYQAVREAILELVPDFLVPENSYDWTPQTLSDLRNQLISLQSMAEESPFDIVSFKTALQNIRFEDVEVAVAQGEASAEVTASLRSGMGSVGAPVLSAAEMISQLEDGDLYVNARGQFFLNRQPTNARDAAVAAFVIGGSSMNDQLADLMNHVNLNNSRIQMGNYLSAATSVANLRERLQDMREQYGFADILDEITGGALHDGDITDSTDITSATGTFQSSLKTAINSATSNQDLDTQSLQTLTAQIQANNTAMTQLIQSFEQLLRSLTQNF